jgi:multiple antibiotic resistance protein
MSQNAPIAGRGKAPMSLDEAVTQFITLFVVLDPAATLPMYLAAVHGLNQHQSTRVALYAGGISFAVLLFFIVFFELLLEAMHIPLPSFQLAGSLVLLIYGLRLVFDEIKADDSLDAATDEGLVARAIFPLTIPGLAGPGTMMTVTLLTDNHRRSVVEQSETVCLVAVTLMLIVLLFLGARPIQRALGKGGLNIISRVMGLILSSIALRNGADAIKLVFGIGA